MARTTVKALRKNVTAKCYGGDVIMQEKAYWKSKKPVKTHEAGGSG